MRRLGEKGLEAVDFFSSATTPLREGKDYQCSDN